MNRLLIDAARSTAVRTPGHPDRPDGWVVQWGAQVRPLMVTRGLPGADVTEQHVAGYLAKYATKATEAAGHLSTRLTESTVRLYADPAKHTGRLIAAWTLGRPAAGSGWSRLRPWAHMLGFGGHFATKSRAYSTTFGALRAARPPGWMTSYGRHGSARESRRPRKCRTVVSGVMGLAVRYGALQVNAAREAARVRGNRRRSPRALTAEERERWLAALEADSRAVRKDLPDLTRWKLAIGLRIGEALAVSWSDVDLEARTVEVDWKLIRIKGEGLRHVRRLKGGDDRTLPLPQFAAEMLHRRLATSFGRGPLFPDALGGWRDPSNTFRDLRTARGTAGFAWVTSHVFRKTCATILDEAGLSARAIADQLGHARPSMTQDVYMDRKVINPQTAEALDAALGKR